jgi:hypothetical protein
MIDIKEGHHGTPTDEKRWPVLAGSDYSHRGHGYGLSYTPISPQTLLWLIFTSVVWIGLLTAYVLSNAVNRVVELLDTISKQLTMTPQEKGKEG